MRTVHVPGCYAAKDLYLAGDITNENGVINIDNREGSISASGAILGETVTITSAKDFSLNVDSWHHTNRDPRQYINYDTHRATVFSSTSGQLVKNTASDVTGLESSINEDESKILALGEINITARYLNVNGLIQSGTDQVEIEIASTFNPGSRTVSFRDEKKNLLPGISFGNANIPVDGYFDVAIGKIVIEDIAPAGGEITIAGQILSTGNGRLKAAHGYTSVNVTNLSQHDLIINKIDVSKKRNGKITIIESDTLTKTVFTTDGTQVTKTTYTGAVADNAINYTASGTPTNYGLTDAIEYAVQANLHYVWTEGQEKTQVTTTKYEQNSFNLIGYDWDFLAADVAYDWQDTEYRDARPLLESESRSTATGNLAHASGKAYTVTYVQKDDDDVDVVQNVTLVKHASTVSSIYRSCYGTNPSR